ncbi:MAG: 4-(cytidine 5'-diphospho)-2-C-methyl-D-erythritol kinase [Ruminococcus sp.]|nr:4-(cytidine 5'-diphospho)-2-C-methyl-D-erythritol kinase [Ruminococcus sp.]
MAELRVRTSAKINLTLDVTGILDNGYHAIESVFQTVGIYDEVTVDFTPAEEMSISVSCEVPEQFASADPIPCDERNIAYKAARIFMEDNSLTGECRIHIKKGIPSQAGMGGGSTDAAAVIYCLSVLTGHELTGEEKAALGARLGADVPFFFAGGTAYVSGIGEKIVPAPDYSGRILVIAKGSEGVSTGEAYRRIDALENPQHPDTKGLVRALGEAPDDAWKYFGNLFGQAIQLEEVDKLESAMLNKGALSATMTGSGSAVFGLFESGEEAEICAEKLRSWGYWAEVCETVGKSFIIID